MMLGGLGKFVSGLVIRESDIIEGAEITAKNIVAFHEATHKESGTDVRPGAFMAIMGMMDRLVDVKVIDDAVREKVKKRLDEILGEPPKA